MFKMWGTLHIIFIISPFIFTILFHFLSRNLNFKQKRKVGILLSSIAILLLLLRNIEIFVLGNYKFDPEIIPFQICHFANFVLFFAFLYNNKVLFTLSFCLNLPAAFLSIIFADSLTNYVTLISFRAQAYLWGHMLIVSITLWALFNDFIKIKTLIKTLNLTIILFIVSVPVNNIIYLLSNKPANYFYSLEPEEGTPLELFYSLGKNIKFLKMEFNPVYLLLLMIVGILVVFLFLIIYVLINKILKKGTVLKD